MRSRFIHQSFCKAASLWLALLFFTISIQAQVTNISGVVNSYYSVIETIPVKACVRVSSTAGLSLTTKVMIIQMKGAAINTPNSAAFGDTSSLANAGNYEFNYICYINGDSVFFTYNLLNSYTASTGKVQLITVAQYENATVTDTLKAKPWDNTTGTGGVIVLDVVDTLVLNAPVYADSSGFRGGLYVQTGGSCTNLHSAYYYNAATTPTHNGAYKGEAVADVIASQSGGRGAPANGGGGGNNHNNSGGGGANLTAGGLGGGNSSSTGCLATYRGMAGKALSNWNSTKIFSGGGGGAGHNNGGFSPSGGGNGGGIIFIHADTLISNGYKIAANGGRGGNSVGDGAGGGGAGGTIIMDVNTYLDLVTIQSNGGAGGTSDDDVTNNKCFGGGGGGSGGAVYFTAAAPAGTITMTAGAGGPEINRVSATCATAQPGVAGTDGLSFTNYSYRIASSFASYCGVILPAKLVSFTARVNNKNVVLNWRMLNADLVDYYEIERKNTAGQWQVIATVAAADGQDVYSTTDHSPTAGDNFYRLKITEKNHSAFYSPIRLIQFHDDNSVFAVYPNPAIDKITINYHAQGPATLFLVDMNGRIILQKMINGPSTQLSLPALAKGIYLLRVNNTVKKLLIR